MKFNLFNVIGGIASFIIGNFIGLIIFVFIYLTFKAFNTRRGLLFIQSYLYLITLKETEDEVKANWAANDLSVEASLEHMDQAVFYAKHYTNGMQLPVIAKAKASGFKYKKPSLTGILQELFNSSHIPDIDKESTKATIKICHDSIERFHNILSDTILEECKTGLHSLPEHARMGIIIYEIQASLAAAKMHKLDSNYHPDFAASILTRGGVPEDQAYGMVEAVAQRSSTSNYALATEAVDGAEGYKAMLQGEANLVEHVKITISKLNSISEIL